jgi:hypothetical protein
VGWPKRAGRTLTLYHGTQKVLDRTYWCVILVYYRMSRSEETAGTDGSGRARYPLVWGVLARQDLVTVGSLWRRLQGQDSIQQKASKGGKQQFGLSVVMMGFAQRYTPFEATENAPKTLHSWSVRCLASQVRQTLGHRVSILPFGVDHLCVDPRACLFPLPSGPPARLRPVCRP